MFALVDLVTRERLDLRSPGVPGDVSREVIAEREVVADEWWASLALRGGLRAT